MDKKFNFTAQVKTSAKEAWEDRPKEWSYNCVVENEIDDDGKEYVEIENRSAGSFGGSSTGHEVFDTFMNEVFKLCRENNLDDRGNQTYCVYDDGEFEVLVHTNYDFWVPRFYSMKMVKKDKAPTYIYQQVASIIESINGSIKALSDCFMNSAAKIEKLQDIATTDLEKESNHKTIEMFKNSANTLNGFVESLSEITDGIHKASVEAAAKQS